MYYMHGMCYVSATGCIDTHCSGPRPVKGSIVAAELRQSGEGDGGSAASTVGG